MATVAGYVLGQRVKRNERYPLVLMLEPLMRCNLSCAGCGKIQYPAPLLRKQLSVADCEAAVDECGAPIVSIAGGEPLMHTEIAGIVEMLVRKRKYIYLCTNAILLERALDAGKFKPSKYLTFSVHMDGLRTEHDASVCREGVYDTAVAAMSRALEAGFRVTTNTTVFEGTEPLRLREFFDEMMGLGVEGMMISPGYGYEKAPDQDHFLARERTTQLFARALEGKDKRWRFNQSPLFLQFLMGKRDYECTPWGNPLYCVFGWQRPCYLLQDGYADSFADLMATTDWASYGHASGNPKCADCMVHSGFEATAVAETFGSIRGFADTVKATVTGRL